MPISLEEERSNCIWCIKKIRKKIKELGDWWDRRYKKEKNGKETILDVEKKKILRRQYIDARKKFRELIEKAQKEKRTRI